jgi:hypothetical protein
MVKAIMVAATRPRDSRAATSNSSVGATPHAIDARLNSAMPPRCSRLEVLPYGVKAAQHYGAIRAALCAA